MGDGRHLATVTSSGRLQCPGARCCVEDVLYTLSGVLPSDILSSGLGVGGADSWEGPWQCPFVWTRQHEAAQLIHGCLKTQIKIKTTKTLCEEALDYNSSGREGGSSQA